MKKNEYILYMKNLNRRIKVLRKLYIKSQKDTLIAMYKKEISRTKHIIKDLNLKYKNKHV